MLRNLASKYKQRKYFDPLNRDSVNPEEFIQILQGKVKNPNFPTDSNYFIVCKSGIEQLEIEKPRCVKDLSNVVESVFNSSKWFGKFSCKTESQIIVPKKYELLINPYKKQMWLDKTERAEYYGSGNLQLDKDSGRHMRLLTTDIDLEKLKQLVKDNCFDYKDGLNRPVFNRIQILFS